MIYAVIAALATIAAFAAFGFIAYTLGRARGFEDCYKLNEQAPLWKTTVKKTCHAPTGKPAQGPDKKAPAATADGPFEPQLYGLLPQEFRTKAVIKYYFNLGQRHGIARHTAEKTINSWLLQGFITRPKRGFYTKATPAASTEPATKNHNTADELPLPLL